MNRFLLYWGCLALVLSSCQNSQEYAAIGNVSISANQPKPQPKQDEGKDVYLRHCMSCHQKNGSGVPGMYPPLQKSNWINGDKKKIINVVLNGLEGEIEVNGEVFSQTMPKQNYLTNKQVAQVLSYLRKNFGNQADSVKVKDVMEVRKSGKYMK